MRKARSLYPWDGSAIRGLLEQNWFVGHLAQHADGAYTSTPDSFAVVSRDDAGVRYAKLSGLAQVVDGDLSVQAATAGYSARITEIDILPGSSATAKSFSGPPARR